MSGGGALAIPPPCATAQRCAQRGLGSGRSPATLLRGTYQPPGLCAPQLRLLFVCAVPYNALSAAHLSMGRQENPFHMADLYTFSTSSAIFARLLCPVVAV